MAHLLHQEAVTGQVLRPIGRIGVPGPVTVRVALVAVRAIEHVLARVAHARATPQRLCHVSLEHRAFGRTGQCGLCAVNHVTLA